MIWPWMIWPWMIRPLDDLAAPANNRPRCTQKVHGSVAFPISRLRAMMSSSEIGTGGTMR
jgi:hypothetical protein